MQADKTRFRRPFRTVLIALAPLVIAACLDPIDPADERVRSVRVTFDGANTSDTIRVRGTTRVRAAALARGGFDIGRTDFIYSSSDTTIAVVDPNGVVRALRPGVVTIRATLRGGPAGEGQIVVVPTTVEFTVPVGGTPGALAFSVDYTRLYATVGTDSLAIVDALGFFRLSVIALGLPTGEVAATSGLIYVTHPDRDSVSVISAGTSTLSRRIFVGAGPTGIAAGRERVYIAARFDRRVVIVEPDGRLIAIPMGGEPHRVAVSRDERRLFALVENGGAWRVVIAAPAFPDTLGSLPLPSAPTAIATDGTGERVYVLLAAESRVLVFAEGADGRYSMTGSVAVGAGATGISARVVGQPLVVVSGIPTTVFNGATLAVSERLDAVGNGAVVVRPDGLFAVVASRIAGVLQVIAL